VGVRAVTGEQQERRDSYARKGEREGNVEYRRRIGAHYPGTRNNGHYSAFILKPF